MPSLRQRLSRKREKGPKKSKSTGDLDQTENNLVLSKEYVSAGSDVGGANTIDVTSEDSSSVISSTSEQGSTKKKKKFSFKKLRKSFSKKKLQNITEGADAKATVLQTEDGGVILVQEVVLKGGPDNEAHNAKLLTENGTPLQTASQPGSDRIHETSKDSNITNGIGKKEDVSLESDASKGVANVDDIDEWRMSGLLDTVERSNYRHSGGSPRLSASYSDSNGSKDKTAEKRLSGVNATSTPVKGASPTLDSNKDLVPQSPRDLEDGDVNTVEDNIVRSEVQVFVTETEKNGGDISSINVVEEENTNSTAEEVTEVSLPEDIVITCNVPDTTRDIVPEEEKFCETHGLDYEYSSQASKVEAAESNPIGSIDGSLEEGEKSIDDTVTEINIHVNLQKGSSIENRIYDVGKGKKVVIRALDQVVKSGEIHIPDEILTNEWLVLNLAKDDWVIVDYNKENGEIIEIFDRSVERVY